MTIIIQDPLCGITPSVNKKICDMDAVRQDTISSLDAILLPDERGCAETRIYQQIIGATGFSAQELEVRKKAKEA